MQCSMCGYVFSEEEGRSGCKGCPFQKNCGRRKCPRCGFEMPPEVGLSKWWGRWRRRRRGRAAAAESDASKGKQAVEGSGKAEAAGALGVPEGEGVVPLAGLQTGEAGKIVALATDPRQTKKLLALGIVPGLRVQLWQRFPAFVLQVGYTQVALDEEMARGILVERENR